MIQVNLEASNKADWIIQITAVDDETAEEIDFTGADISFVVKDENCCAILTATTALGNITLPTGVLIEIQFTPDQMGAVCSGRYSLGCVYEINDETTQLLTGYVDVYDGIASL
jgi:hypothetical protein